MVIDDTIVALSSASGAGRRAIIRLSGPRAILISDRVFLSDRSPSTTHVQPGTLSLSQLPSALPADRYLFRAPRSYTGQDLVELHTIGSPPLIERLVADLLAAGARTAMPGEFTMRAFLAGKKDLTRAEAVIAVIEATDDENLKHALTQLAGGLAQPLDSLRDDLLNLLADIEAALDFVEEDIEFVSQTETLRRLATGLAQLTNVRRQLMDRGVSGRPVRIAFAGRPNAGKSSLFNALIAQNAAIVSEIPGTTRDYLTTRIEWAGITLELIDTAGWEMATSAIEQQAQQLGREQQHQADLIVWCVPCSESLTERERPTGRVVCVRTKADHGRVDGMCTSTIDGSGIAELREVLSEMAKAIVRPLAPSQSRCRHHIDAAIDSLRRAHRHAIETDPPELLALELRKTLDAIGEMVGAVYTNDLLDRIFSRFCIGK